MIKRIVLAALALSLAACSPPAGEAPEGSAEPTSAQSADAPPAGGEDAIRAWVQQDTGGNMIGDPEIFYGDFSGDGAADALVHYLTPLGGSGFNVNWALFRNESGTMTFVRREEAVYGTEPRDVVFANGSITLTTTMPREGDPHCCPTGSQNWTIATN